MRTGVSSGNLSRISSIVLYFAERAVLEGARGVKEALGVKASMPKGLIATTAARQAAMEDFIVDVCWRMLE